MTGDVIEFPRRRTGAEPRRRTGAELRRLADELLTAGRHRADRKAHLHRLAALYDVALPGMPAGDVTAIHRAEQALIDAAIDPGPWDPRPDLGDRP